MRRPLYGAAFLLFLICLALPPSLWMHTGIREGTAVVTGTVGRREQREETQIYYLKNTNISGARWILVYLKDSKSQYFIGNTLRIYGTIKQYEPPRNPGQFDSRMYAQIRKIDGLCFADRAECLDDTKYVFPEKIYQVRRHLSRILEQNFDSRDSGLLKAMLLGERQDLQPDVKSLYQLSGIAHLLAISGLHISILGRGLYQLLRRLGLPCRAAGIPALMLMGCYGVLVGSGASVLRALIMFALWVGADFCRRTYDMQTALGTAAMGLLLEQPLYARDGAFQLSFGAVVGLAELTPLLQAVFRRKRGTKPTALCASLGIQMITLPVLMRCFYQLPVYGPFLNLLAVPLLGPLLVACLWCMLCEVLIFAGLPMGLAGFCRGFSACLTVICEEILRVLDLMAKGSLRMPGALLCTGIPSTWQTAVYYAALLLLLTVLRQYRTEKQGEQGHQKEKMRQIREQSRKKLCLAAIVVYGIGLCQLFWRPEPAFSMTLLDVGQGDAIYFSTRSGSTYLVDGGSSSEKQVGSYILEPFFKSQGKDRVDYLLVTHGDKDHISGIAEILEEGLLEVGCLILPEAGKILEETGEMGRDAACLELESLALERQIPVIRMKAGDCLQEGRLCLRCLGPEDTAVYESKNAASLVLELEYGNLRILLTGDLEGEGEQRVVEQGLSENGYDILKVAHHGSRYSTGEELLLKVRPSVSLISCGEQNSYGHPHRELLDRLEETGSRIYQTSQNGAVTVKSDGNRYKIRTFLP